MIKPTFDEVLQNAKSMPLEIYMDYCDTIDDIQLASADIFQGRQDSNVIRLERFFWPHWLKLTPNGVYGYQEPGAYVEIYDIFAVNRKTNVAWSLYVTNEYDETRNPTNFLLPKAKKRPIYDAVQEIMDRRQEEDYNQRSDSDSEE
jgi:hypothetical protein